MPNEHLSLNEALAMERDMPGNPAKAAASAALATRQLEQAALGLLVLASGVQEVLERISQATAGPH